jgi:hypothetical protein
LDLAPRRVHPVSRTGSSLGFKLRLRLIATFLRGRGRYSARDVVDWLLLQA